MATVKVTVLRPFGEFKKGNAEVEESRLAYLEKKGLVKKGHNAAPEAVDAPLDDSRLEAAVTTLSTALGITRSEGEPAMELLERMAKEATGKSADEQSGEGGEEKPPTFEEHLRKSLSDAIVTELFNSNFRTPEDILDATDEQLDAVEGVGQATIEKIREAVDSFGA